MSKNVCVVEDNVPIRKLECTLLKRAGNTVNDFGDGASALAWIKTNKPDLMIVDILLPDTNGTEIMKEVKSMPDRRDFPIVAATGFAQLNDKEKYLEAGFDAYIAKPLDIANFISEINKICDDFAAKNKK